MVNILCLKWGTKYGPEYVNILYAAIRRHTTVPFTLHCFTDNITGLRHEIKTHPLPFNTLEGWWNKLYFFSKQLPFAPGETLFFFDLDTLVTNDLDRFLKYKATTITVLRDFYSGIAKSVAGHDNIGSGLMAWKHGQYHHIWALFEANPEAAMRSVYPHGDQRWIQRHANPRKYWQDELPNTVVSFKVHCLNGLPPTASIVCYHGKPSIPESITARMKDWIWQITPQPWVADHWVEIPPKSKPAPSKAPAVVTASKTQLLPIKTYFVTIPARKIFGSIGRCGGGHNTVWEDWSTRGRRARAHIIAEFEAGMDKMCGHYSKLEASMLAEGMRNPLIVTCGPPLKRDIKHLPPELRLQPQHKWLLLEGTSGGSRLWVAQKHNLDIECFVNDSTNSFAGNEEITTVEQAATKYRDPPKPGMLVLNNKVGLAEGFDQTKVGHHLGSEWSEDRMVQERAPLWVSIMNRHGYYVDRLPPFVLALLKEAGVEQPLHLKKRLTYR